MSAKNNSPRSGKFRLIIIGAGRAFLQMEDALFNNPHFEIHEVMDDSGIGSISRQMLDFNALHADYRAGIYDAAFVATGNNQAR